MVLLQLVISVCLAAQVLSSPTAHFVLIIGQSNAIGYNNDGPTAEDVSYENILQVSCCSKGSSNNAKCKLITAQDPLHHNCTKEYLNSKNVGFGMTFVRQLRADVPQDDIIVIVPAALGDSGFVDNVWTAYNGTGFVKAQQRFRKGVELVKKDYPEHVVVFDAILWHQGEKDAGEDVSTSRYLKKDLIPMIKAWRDPEVIEQANDHTPFVVGNLLPSWAEDCNNPNRLGVLIALQLLNQYVPFSGVAPSQGLIGDGSEDAVHFTAQSQRILGRRFYQAWKAAKLNNKLSNKN